MTTSDEQLSTLLESAIDGWLETERACAEIRREWLLHEEAKWHRTRDTYRYPPSRIPLVAQTKALSDRRWREAVQDGQWHMTRVQSAALALLARHLTKEAT